MASLRAADEPLTHLQAERQALQYIQACAHILMDGDSGAHDVIETVKAEVRAHFFIESDGTCHQGSAEAGSPHCGVIVPWIVVMIASPGAAVVAELS